ncbi:MAG: hypothetical protein IJK98_09830, partial [Clostridia bacterium]|nr:hypothetical protein [Clostridia bacterium]
LTVEDTYGAIEVMVFPKRYDTYGPYLIEDEIVLITAKVSLSDDEVPKLLLEECVPLDQIPDDAKLLENYKLPERDYAMRQSAYTMFESGEAYQAPTASYEAPPVYDEPPAYDAPPAYDEPPAYDAPSHAYQPGAYTQAPSAYTASVAQAAAPAKKSRVGLFLRVSGQTAEDCRKAKKMCSIFEGGLPLILYYTDESRYDFASGIRTDNNPDLVRGLKKLLGEKNVVVKT